MSCKAKCGPSCNWLGILSFVVLDSPRNTTCKLIKHTFYYIYNIPNGQGFFPGFTLILEFTFE